MLIRYPFAIAVSLLLLTSSVLSPVQAQAGRPSLGPTGTVWGGEHVELEVTAEGATLEFDCAAGTITKPLQVDAQGGFKATGTFTREHGGPVMRDGNTAAAATYSGSIVNGAMKLTITGNAQNQSLGDYILVQGKPGHVIKCR